MTAALGLVGCARSADIVALDSPYAPPPPEAAPEPAPVDLRFVFEPRTAFDDGDIDHLLTRTEFGVTVSSRERARSLGIPTYIDEMLAFDTSGNSLVEQAAFQFLVNANDPPGLEGRFPASIPRWWLYLMMHTPTPFQERLALFWHDHFAVSAFGLGSPERYVVVDYVQKLRQLGLGDFHSLVLELARDPAMLLWLDGVSNVVEQPNENFAREFFELFTLGAGNGYTEEDVREASRAFSGYRTRLGLDGLRFIEFDPERKDAGEKVLFDEVLIQGSPGSDDFALVVDATFASRDVASWLAEKIAREFFHDDPEPALVEGIAHIVRRHAFEMRPIFRELFLSEAFYARQKNMVRMPVDYAVGLVRATGLYLSPEQMRQETVSLAQIPTEPPSVFGWPQGDAWLSAAAMVQRTNMALRMINTRPYQNANGYDVSLPDPAATPAQVVDHFARLLGVTPTREERADLIGFLDTNVLPDGTLVPDPFDPSDYRHVDDRVRGVLFLLATHPDALHR